MSKKASASDKILIAITILGIAILMLIPTGFERTHPGERVSVEVVSADNANIRRFGIVKTGDQGLAVRIRDGRFKGEQADAVNHLIGKMEFDRCYRPGDTALATLSERGGDIVKVTMVDYYRLNKELILFSIFALSLLLFGGWTGARSLLSFMFTAVVLWKLLLPGMLRGWNPIVSSLAVSALLCVVIILLVSGLNRKSLTAVSGALCGIAATCVLALVFGREFSIHGAVKPFSETLLYSGFAHLDLTGIFLGGIFLASSGAVMDLSMDIASAQHEIALQNPFISRRDLMLSGFSVARMVIGTMTTTLLLAYTGGFTTLLMVFIAQGTPLANVFNIQYVAAEILHTMAGSVGLVMVAPLTAVLGSFFLATGTDAQFGKLPNAPAVFHSSAPRASPK